jgi:HEAT repeat protein
VLQAVQDMPTGETVVKIAGMLQQLSDGAKIQLLSALARHPDPAILRIVTGALRGPSGDVRTAAVRTLSRIGTAASVRPLAVVASSVRGAEQREAREGLASLGAPGTDDSLIVLLAETSEAIRSEALRAMRERRVPSTVGPLLATLKDRSPRVRQDAALALRLIAGERDVPTMLGALLAEKAEEPRRELENSIVATSLRIPDVTQRDPAVIAALAGTKVRENRMSLLRVLGKIGTPGALKVIMPALKDRNKDVMLAAVRALSEWPTPAAYDELRVLASGTKENTVRTLALRGAVRTTGLDTMLAHDAALQRYRSAFALARTTEEKRQLLSLIGAAPSRAAFDIAVDALRDPALNADAEVALVTCAEGIAVRDGNTIAPRLEGLLGSSNPTVREKSRELLNRIESLEDYITLWEYAGPFTEERVNLFEHSFAPEMPEASHVQWRKFPESSDPGNAVLLAFDRVFGGTNRVVYLRTTLHVPAATKARIECGSDDGIKIWLNGTLVHENNADRSVVPGDDKVPVELQSGWTAMLVKVTQGGGEWGACVRVRGTDGSRIRNIRYSLTQE